MIDPYNIAAQITGITADSRIVKDGFLFAAIKGEKADGHDYIEKAQAAGATFVLSDANSDNVRRDYALIAAAFYKDQPKHIAAVTGTNGKSSVVEFTRQILQASGYEAAALGTIGIKSTAINTDGGLTTPDAVSLQKDLADLAQAGVTHSALEASSHGLDQYRLDGVNISCAAFTNISRDHLDYHGDEETYFKAKERLFSALLPRDGVAVINADDPYGQRLIGESKVQVISYGFAGVDLKLTNMKPCGSGQIVTLEYRGKTHDLNFPLVGAFQVMNALAAFGMAQAISDQDISIYLLEKLLPVKGRLEIVSGHPRGADVYVDYAHAPGGIEAVLQALRPHTKNKLICLFGCGGDRDRGKRPLMGQAAVKYADIAILADDNPRGEDPEQIRGDVISAVPDVVNIGDRRAAIIHALSLANEGDVVAVTGKGHEQGQVVKGHTYPFNDVEEVKKAFEKEEI